MREIKRRQMQLGEVSIESIEFDIKSRDDIPQILKGLQYLYCNQDIRNKIFEVLERLIPAKVNKNTGRPGLCLWNILVLGMLRLNLDWNYDRLQQMANNHQKIRQMLGHGDFDKHYYNLQTLKDNIGMFTPQILDEINQIIVAAGHKLVKKKIRNRYVGAVIRL